MNKKYFERQTDKCERLEFQQWYLPQYGLFAYDNLVNRPMRIATKDRYETIKELMRRFNGEGREVLSKQSRQGYARMGEENL